MTPRDALSLALDPSRILAAQNLTPDPWQRDLLFSTAPYLLLNCSRQSGKSTTVAALALHELLTRPGALVLLVAPSQRQSHELFRKLIHAYHSLGPSVPAIKSNQSELDLANSSRVVALPGQEGTIRSFSGVRLLIIDEAARVPDDLYRSVRPMLAVSRGRLIALSTPFGRRGWFHDEWTGAGPWQRIHIPWTQCPRIDPAFIAEETRALGQSWVDQEYAALFTTMEGLVYPDFDLALINETSNDPTPKPEAAPSTSYLQPKPEGESSSLRGSPVGGIDFGWRNPFAAVWGFLDADDVLWLEHERYLSAVPIADHAAALPKDVTWYADPAGATEIGELRRAGLIIKRGENTLRRGISLVTARLRTGRLKIRPGACPNLLREARLYRYPSAAERPTQGENPIDQDNHALAALRYLISRLPTPHAPPPLLPTEPVPKNPIDDDRLWTPM